MCACVCVCVHGPAPGVTDNIMCKELLIRFSVFKRIAL